MKFLPEYKKKLGLGGGGGYIDAESAEAAMEQLMRQDPGCIAYSVVSVDDELVSEDLPPAFQWTDEKAGFFTCSNKQKLFEGFLAWTQELGYIRHTTQQEAIKELRRQVKSWAASANAPDPRFTWLAVYRCGTGDWDLERTLTRVRQSQHCQFISYVKKVRAIVGDRPQPLSKKFWDIYSDYRWCQNQNQAIQEKAEIEEFLKSYFINVLLETLIIKPARSGSGCFICIMKHTQLVVEEVQSACERMNQANEALLDINNEALGFYDDNIGYNSIVWETAAACGLEVIEA